MYPDLTPPPPECTGGSTHPSAEIHSMAVATSLTDCSRISIEQGRLYKDEIQLSLLAHQVAEALDVLQCGFAVYAGDLSVLRKHVPQSE